MPPAKRAGDLTGRTTERLQKENAEELKERAKEIALLAEVTNEENAKPVDYSKGPVAPAVQETPLEVSEDVELKSATRVIIPNTDLESVTFGAGNHYNFEEGRKYTVPRELAEHLSEKGLIWEGKYR